MRRIWAFIIVSVLTFSFGSFAWAESSVGVDQTNKNEAIVISEKDLIISWINSTDEELKSKGYSDSEISEIRSYDFEKLFLERSALSEEILKNFGYSNPQIKLLKNYNGETITADSPVLAAADMTISFSKSAITSTSKKVYVNANWSWNIVPIFKSTDLFVVPFQGVNTGSSYIDLTPTTRSGSIKYYQLTTGLYDHSTSFTGAYDSIKRAVSVSVPMVKNDNYYWAKEGYILLGLESQNTSASISYVNLGAHYGHRTLSFSGGISFSVSGVNVSFTPTSSTVTSGAITGRVTSNGAVTNY